MNETSLINEWFQKLGIPEGYARSRALKPVDLCDQLVSVGYDVFGREQRAHSETVSAWQAMQTAAEKDGIELALVSAFRDVEYQAQLIERKLQQGQTIEQILSVSAAPGYSEHHSGRALDLTTPDTRPLEPEFGDTEAYQWLVSHAGQFDFVESFGRNNQHGLIWEPWHWCHQRFLIWA